MAADVGEVAAVALERQVDADEAERQRRRTDGDVDIDDVAKGEIDVVEEEVKIRAGHERVLEVGAGDALDFGFPPILEANYDGDPVRLARLQPRDAGVPEVDEQALPRQVSSSVRCGESCSRAGLRW